MNKKKPTIEELEKRIKTLEERQAQMIIPAMYYVPYPAPQPQWRCPICGGTGGCMHVTCQP